MTTTPTPPRTAIAPVALTAPSNCIAFTRGTALMTANESETPNHTQRIKLDFIEFSRSCEIEISAPALYESQLLGVSMEPGGTKQAFVYQSRCFSPGLSRDK